MAGLFGPPALPPVPPRADWSNEGNGLPPHVPQMDALTQGLLGIPGFAAAMLTDTARNVQGAMQYDTRLPHDQNEAAVRSGAALALDTGMVGSAIPSPGFGTFGGRGIRAYHGSPHDFDRFDMSKIGTGEGAQAYGHGLYFAGNEAVARNYRKALTSQAGVGGTGRVSVFSSGGKEIPSAQRSAADIAHTMQTYNINPNTADGALWLNSELDARYMGGDDVSEALVRELYDAGPLSQQWVDGRMYEVNINANPEDFLDWDAPLSEQPNVLRDFRHSNSSRQYVAGEMPGATNPPTGESMYRELLQSNPAALQDAGIPGIKYLDQGSRAVGDGTRNYVVFDDSLIEILRKYGLFPGMVGAGAAGTGLLDYLNPEPTTQSTGLLGQVRLGA